jgi:hypothetical protein
LAGTPLPATLGNRGTGDWDIHYPHTLKKILKILKRKITLE